MSTDQELRAKLSEVIDPLGHGDTWDAAGAILDYPELLDEICEYRARQINAEVDAIAKAERKPQTWKSVYDIPFGMKFRGTCGVDAPVTIQPIWQRLTGSACHMPGAPVVESSRALDARYPNGFSEAFE